MDIKEFLEKNKTKLNIREENVELDNNLVASNNNIVPNEELSIDEFINKYSIKEDSEPSKPLGETIKDIGSNVYKGAIKNVSRYNAVGSEALADVLDFLTPMGNNVVSPYLREYSKEQKEVVKNLNNEDLGISGLVGEIVADPINVLPSGIVSQGGKVARMGKSALAGAGIGAGTQEIKNIAEDTQGEDIVDAGLIGGGVNALISGLTRGKVDNAQAIKNEISNFLKKEEVAKAIKTPQEQSLVDELLEISKRENPTINDIEQAVSKNLDNTEVINKTDDISVNNVTNEVSLQPKRVADDITEVGARVDSNIPITTDDTIAEAMAKEISDMTAKQEQGTQAYTPFDEYMATKTDDEINQLFGATSEDIYNIKDKIGNGKEITQSERNLLNNVYREANNQAQMQIAKYNEVVGTLETLPQADEMINAINEVVSIGDTAKLSKAVEQYDPIKTMGQNIARDLLFSGVGSVAGAGSEIGSAYYEDREIDPERLLGGAITGGLIGYGASKGRTGLTVENIAKNTPVSNVEPSKNTLKSVLDTIKENTIVDYVINSKLWKHKDYMDMSSDMFLALDKGGQAVAEYYRGFSKLSSEVRKELHEYLVGDIADARPSVKKLAKAVRENINEQAKRAVDAGLLSQEAVDEWGDIYLYRTYEKTADKSIKERLSKATTINPLYPRGKIWVGSKEELQEYIDNDMIGRLSEGKISYTENGDGTVEFRRDYTKEERTAMKEVTDGALTIANTMQRLNNLVVVGKFLKDTNDLYGVVSREKMAGYTQLSGAKWGALNGRYVPDEIANNLKAISIAVLGRDNPLKESWQDYLRLYKRTKTVYSPKTHISNVINNTALLMLEGYPTSSALSFIIKDSLTLNSLEKVKELKALNMVGQLDDAGRLQLQKLLSNKNVQRSIEADSYGLFEGNRIDELLMKHADPSVTEGTGFTDKLAVKTKTKPIFDKMRQAYTLEDNSAKLSMYNHLRDNKGYTPEEAIKEIRRLLPDYRQPMSRTFQFLRDSGIMPFVSWTYYVMPALLKQISPVWIKDSKVVSNLKSDVGTGLNKYRLYNVAKILGTVAMLDLILTPDTNIWSSDQPEGFRGKRIPLHVDSQGNVTGLKIDRWIPQMGFLPVGEFFRSQLAGGIPQKALYNIVSEQDPYFNNKITYNTGLRGAYDKAEYGVKSYVPLPQPVYDVFNIGKAMVLKDEDKRRTQKVTNPKSLGELLSTLAGANLQSYNTKAYQKQKRNEELKEKKQKERNK